jgi:tetratricopeptide (TPR) repeat protein
LTPERLEAENRRSDLFITVGVLIVAFLLGFYKIADPDLWIHLKSGWHVHHQGAPSAPFEDPFSYSTAGKAWLNLNWLYDWGVYQAELAETRLRARRLADEYDRLIEKHAEPRFDEGQEIAKTFPEAERTELARAVTTLRDAANTSDTFQMRWAAEQLVSAGQAAELELPTTGTDLEPADYPEVTRWFGHGGGSMVNLAALVVIKSLLLVLLAGLLLAVRHPGPTRWWTAVAVVLALVGMSDWLYAGPHVVGLVLLAATLVILQQVEVGRCWMVWLLLPVQILWVNVDSLFVLGLVIPGIVLACAVARRLAGLSDAATDPFAGGRLGVLAAAVGLSALVTLANPYGFRVWSVPYEPVRDFVTGWMPHQGTELATSINSAVQSLLTTAFWSAVSSSVPAMVVLALIVLALASFPLNWRGWDTARLLTLLLTVVMLAVADRHVTLVALVCGVILALNGQEWFLRRFGTEPRISGPWPLWSRGGRVATLLALTAVAVARITGWMGTGESTGFGWGVQWAAFDLETGKFLRQTPLEGRAMNTVLAQGNLLAWSSYPARQVFAHRQSPLDRAAIEEFTKLRLDLRHWSDEAAAEPADVLDKYHISHVVLNLSDHAGTTFKQTFNTLARSEQWKLVHWDAAGAVFGRVNLPEGHPLAADARWFQEHAFDAARLVFRSGAERLPEPPPPVAPPTFIDRFWRTRRFATAQSALGLHLLNETLVPNTPGAQMFVPPPEYCLLAIRAARQSLAREPAAAQSYGVLADAYYYLLLHELAQVRSPQILELRMIQLLSALNQTVSAKPDHPLARRQLADWHARQGHLDLAAGHYEKFINLLPPDSDLRAQYEAQASQLAEQIERVRIELDQAATRLPTPAARAQFLFDRGCVELAIRELTQSVALALPGVDTVPMLVRYYIRTGEAGDVETGAEAEMRTFEDAMKNRGQSVPAGLRPGMWEEMWATVKLMQGDYKRASTYLETAIAKTRYALARDLLGTTSGALRGAVDPIAGTAVTLTDDADRQGRLEFHLGVVQLEAGEPMEAARHFKRSLELREDSPYRPVIGFYLEKITGEVLEPLPPPEEAGEMQPAEVPAKPEPPKPPQPEPATPPSRPEKKEE